MDFHPFIVLIDSSHFSTEPHPLHSILCTAGFDTCLSLSLPLPLYYLCLIFVVSFLKSGLTSPLVLHVSFLIHSSSFVPCLLCSCLDLLLSLLHSSIIPAWPAFVFPSFLLQSSFGSPLDLPSYPHYSCFLPRCRLFSLFLPSGDAAKRKAWKLNRVSSLRSIYTNSLQNSEGKEKNCCGGTDRPPTDLYPDPPSTAGLESPVLEICAFDSRMSWWFAEKDNKTGFESLTCLSKQHWDTFITWRLIL